MPTEEEDNLEAPYYNDHYTKVNLMYGMHGYHSGDRNLNIPVESMPPTNFFIGNELEMAFKTERARDAFCDKSSNWYVCERDSSIRGNGPLELITIPLHPDDACNPEFWEPLCTALTAGGARSWTNDSTGHHVHISRSFFVDKNAPPAEQYLMFRNAVKKMASLYALFIEDNPSAHFVFGRTRCYSQTKMKGPTVSAIAEITPQLMLSNTSLYYLLEKDATKTERYMEVNTRPSQTVEFRMGKGSINEFRIAAINEFVLLFSKWSRGMSIESPQCTLDNFEEYLRDNANKNGILCNLYFNEPYKDGKMPPQPRG